MGHFCHISIFYQDKEKKMVVLLVLTIILSLPGLKIAPENMFHQDYMGKKQTTMINGFFVILVFMSHAVQYLDLTGSYHQMYLDLRDVLKQAVVVTFLFYSGYGMMEAIKMKGKSYINQLPLRGLKVLLQFDVAVLLFLITNYFIDKPTPLKQTLLAFTSWTAVGNSNWYITAILIMYLLIFISFKLGRTHKIIGVAILVLLTLMYIYISMKIERPSRYYNTIICLPVGMIFSLIKPRFDRWVTNDLRFLAISLVALCLAIYAQPHMGKSIEHYSLWMIMFAIIIVLISQKVQLNSPWLEWMGKRVFSIYILQRIPMRLLEYYGFNTHFFIFMSLSFIMTLLLAILFDRYVGHFVNHLFTKK